MSSPEITISAATIVSTLREESERFQCLAVAQMAIRESCAERLQACPELRDDVRIADARKEAYEAAATRLQGILEKVLGKGTTPAPSPTLAPMHPLINTILSAPEPSKAYEALAQLSQGEGNVPVDDATTMALRRRYREVSAKLSGASDVEDALVRDLIEMRRGDPPFTYEASCSLCDELQAWQDAFDDVAAIGAATEVLITAITATPWSPGCRPLVEATVAEILRLRWDAAIRATLGISKS